jgi:parvulin-like peptidyl-prolyl isomerase
MSKRQKFVLVALILLIPVFLFGQEVVEAIVAIVNEDIITLSQFEAEHEALYQFLRSQLQGEEFDKQYEMQKKGLLDRMITELLLVQEAEKKELNVSEQLKMLIDNIKEQYEISSDDQLRRIMQQQGIDYEAWRKQQERALLQQAVVFTEVGRSIVIDETDVVNYYDQNPEEFTEPPEYKLRAIFISSEGKSEENAQKIKSEIDGKLANGEDISELAGQYSEGPEKESQGDLGTFKKGELAENLQQEVENLASGEMSSWIEMPTGWYKIKVEEKKDSRLKTFEEVKKEIEEKLFRREEQKKLQEYLEDLKKRSFIKILIPNPLDYR